MTVNHLVQQQNYSVLRVFLNQGFLLLMDKNNQKVSKHSFFRTSMNFYTELAIFEPQNNVVVEQFGTENIPLITGCLV